ncbi:MAG TPA: peptidoglycan editing factor PgeF [Thermosynechococcaceae cyanobacterium]
MHTWNWRSWNGLPYLTCSLLEPWPHGFFTQQFWGHSPIDLTPVLYSSATTYRIKQVHGAVVLRPSELLTEELSEADGLVTEQANQAVWVCSADCTPALVADVATGQVAAVHAGWRGTALKILPETIARLRSQGSQFEDLRVALGPAIAGEVYQVSEPVAAEVGGTVATALNEGVLEQLQQLPNPPILDDPEVGRVRLDVRRVNALQLEQLGLSTEQVAIAPNCTFQDSQNFFSYRRSREKKVQWSGIVSL